ncbi:MAG: ATP-binding protein, partial [Deltaproteobacteria bacterium]|nr:ATP-binding protein [Deltaproteobacteria bacterium]
MEQQRPHIPDHCRALGFVGEQLVPRLSTQLGEQLLQACCSGRPLLITGHPGSGRTSVARLAHRAAGAALGRTGSMVSIDCSGSEGMLYNAATSREMLAIARRGTLVLDGVERLPPAAQLELAALLGGPLRQAARAQASPLLVLVGREGLGGSGRVAGELASRL